METLLRAIYNAQRYWDEADQESIILFGRVIDHETETDLFG